MKKTQNRKHSIRYQGVLYKNKKQLARTLGIHYPILQKSLFHQEDVEKAIEDAMKLHLESYGETEKAQESYPKKRQVMYQGILYENKKQLAKELGIAYHYVRIALYEYEDVDKAIEIAKMNHAKSSLRTSKKPFIVEYNGKVYKTKKELAKDYNIPYGLLIDRLEANIPIDVALTKGFIHKHPFVKKRKKKRDAPCSGTSIEFEGKMYISIRQFASEMNIPYLYFYKQYRKTKSVKEALSKAKCKKEARSFELMQVEYQGVIYRSLLSFTNALNLKYGITKYYLKKGLSIEEVLKKNVHKS